MAYTKLPHFRHTPLPLVLAVIRIFNPEGLFFSFFHASPEPKMVAQTGTA